MASVELRAKAEDFDTDDYALCVNNGWVNLRDGRLQCHDPTKRFSMTSYASYAAERGSPLWHKTVGEVFKGNIDLMTYFQRAVGYSVLGGNSEQVLLYVMALVLMAISVARDHKKCAWFLCSVDARVYSHAWQAIHRGANPEIARLRGIRFALASETEKGQRWSANKIKTLTGGDTVASRGLYQDMIEFKSKATIWVACNHKPEVDASDAAMWRRIRLIPFARVFRPDEQDPELAEGCLLKRME